MMSLNIIHTSDWHLGKKLFKHSRIQEQAQFLNFLEESLIKNHCEVLIISGDIFDTPYPPNEALSLYLKFLHKITTSLGVKIFIISGNHDSGRFLETQKPFFEELGIEIRGYLNIERPSDLVVTIKGKSGLSCKITLLPYFRTADILAIGKKLYPEIEVQEEGIPDIKKTILNILDQLFSDIGQLSSKEYFNILMAHHLFAGYEASGSEQGLSLSGIEQLPLSLVKDRFQYIALGHIHKYKIIQKSNPTIIYSGSPISFRFNEEENKKIVLLKITAAQSFTYHPIAIPRFRKLINLECSFESLLSELEKIKSQLQPRPQSTTHLESKKKDLLVNHEDDLLHAHIVFKDPSIGVSALIRNELKQYKVQLISYQASYGQELVSAQERQEAALSFKLLTPKDLFETYYLQKHPESKAIPKELLSDFLGSLDEYLSLTEEKGERI